MFITIKLQNKNWSPRKYHSSAQIKRTRQEDFILILLNATYVITEHYSSMTKHFISPYFGKFNFLCVELPHVYIEHFFKVLKNSLM
jgi:hypothetical protein